MADQEGSSKSQIVLLVFLIVIALLLVGVIGCVLLRRNQKDQSPTATTSGTQSQTSTTGEAQPTESKGGEETFPSYAVAPSEPEETQPTQPTETKGAEEISPGYTEPKETQPTEPKGTEESSPGYVTVPGEPEGNQGSSNVNGDSSQAGNTASYINSIFHVEHANLYTGVRINTVSNSTRNKVTAAVVGGKGYQGSNAIAYIISDDPGSKEESNELILSYDTLGSTGFQKVQIQSVNDVIWLWVSSECSSDQLLHVNINSKNVAANTPVYTISGGQIQTVNYNADHTKVKSMGPVPYTMDSSDQAYARIKVCKGWSGWIGIPVSAFSLRVNDPVDTVIFRLYGKSNSLKFGDAMYLDELQLASSNQQPKMSKSSANYTTEMYAKNPDLFVPVWKGKWTVPAGMLDFEEKYRQFFDPKGRVLSVAHRGDRNGYYPENSLEGILSSIHAGADIIELDIAKTKDGHLILMHDDTITATTNIGILRTKGLADHLPASDYVADWTLAQLQELHLLDNRNSAIVTNYTIPTLRDAIKVCKDHVFITLDKSSRFDWYLDIWPLMQELNAYRTVMVPYNYTSSIGYSQTAKMLKDIKSACGYDAVYMADARSNSLPYITSQMEVNGIPKALRISEYDPAKYSDFMIYTGKYRIYAETIKAGADVALWTEMADRGYNIIMGWGDIYALTKFVAQRHFS